MSIAITAAKEGAPHFDASWVVDVEHPDGHWKFHKYSGREDISAAEFRRLREQWWTPTIPAEPIGAK